MEQLKAIIEQHSLDELTEIFYRDLGPYYSTKLAKALGNVTEKAEMDNFEAEKPKTSELNIELGIPLLPKVSAVEIGEVVHKLRESVLENTKSKEQELIENEIQEWEDVGSTVKFNVDRDSGIVKAIVRDKYTSEIDEIGKAVCNEKDEFNEDIGKLIAIYKAGYPKDWKQRLIDLGYKQLFI